MFEPLTIDRVMNANNKTRFSRPDTYLGVLNRNRQAYVSAVMDSITGRKRSVNITSYNSRETVPAMVQDLVNNKSYTV